MIGAVIVVAVVGQIDSRAILATAGLLVLAAALLCAAALLYLRSRRLQQQRDWQRRLDDVCQEAKTIVDLTTPTRAHDEPLTTHGLRSVAERVGRLDRRLAQLAATATSPRTTEAIDDLRRVSNSLVAALDAERSLRIEATGSSVSHRAESWARVTKRSSELDLAASELQWLGETGH